MILTQTVNPCITGSSLTAITGQCAHRVWPKGQISPHKRLRRPPSAERRARCNPTHRNRNRPPQYGLPLWTTIRHIFAYTRRMSFGFPILERKQFVVTCKRCRRDVPAGVREFPFQPIVVSCPLCGEMRRFLPSEVFLGQPNVLVSKQARRREI